MRRCCQARRAGPAPAGRRAGLGTRKQWRARPAKPRNADGNGGGPASQLIARPDAESQPAEPPPAGAGRAGSSCPVPSTSIASRPQLRPGRTPPVEELRALRPSRLPQPQTEQAAQQARQNRIYENFHEWVLFPIVSGLIGPFPAGWCIGRWCYYAANPRTTKLLFP